MDKNSRKKIIIIIGILIFGVIVLIIFNNNNTSVKEVQNQSLSYIDDIDTYKTLEPSSIINLSDGDTLDLEASIVKQELGGRMIKRLAYNGQIPGPVIKVQKGASVTVNLKNSIDVDTTLHSHGLRLDNKFDGVPDITQEPIKPGETFSYTLTFPDEGVYWYHPHIREDYTQELGLYGNIIVDGELGYWSEANQEEYLIFDDFLEQEEFDSEKVTHTLMGRFGDTLLINDKKDFKVTVEKGQLNRFFLTNVANTRVFDLEFKGSKIKHVGGDVGRIQKEEFIDDVVIAPAERYVIETLYPQAGTFAINHRGQKIGEVIVTESEKDSSISTFNQLRDNSNNYKIVLDNINNFLSKKPDKSLRFNIEMKGGMQGMMMGDNMQNMDHGSMMMDSQKITLMGMEMTKNQAIEHCKMMPNMAGCEPYLDNKNPQDHQNDGIEWEDDMAMMNQMSNDQNLEWQIIDQATGEKNMDIDWSFNQGDLVKIRIYNDPSSMHPMQHPIHFHGQRFVVLERDGVPNKNLQWKDTTLIPTGQTIDVLVEMSNPGTWMTHCHIAEHLHAGMMFGFEVK
jgi:FtsP/CotA-like multicopper oxidase with cupredoxin domain